MLLTACGKSHAAFPSQEEWGPGKPVHRPSRSGVCAGLSPRSGNERRCIPAEAAPHREDWPFSVLTSLPPPAVSPHFSYSPSSEGLDSPKHDGGDGLEPPPGELGRPPAGTARRRRAAGRTLQFRGGPLSAGISAFGGIHPREWQTPFVAVRATCLRSVKADGKEPPVTLGVVVSDRTGETRMIGPSAHQARQKMPRHSRWLGAASSVLVSRSRAYGPEAGPVLPVGAPSRSCRCAVGHTPSHLLGVRAETGAIPAIGVFAAAALRAAVPAGGRRSKPSPPWRHQLYALSGPSALSASGRGCYSRQPVGGRCPLSTPRHVDQRPRVTRSRHPRQQVAMPWRALRAVSMRNAG